MTPNIKMHIMIRHLAWNLSQLGKRHHQTSRPAWIDYREWDCQTYKVDPILSHELLKACVLWTPNLNTWDLRPYSLTAILSELPPKHQAEFIRLFKLLHPPSWTSSPQTNSNNC